MKNLYGFFVLSFIFCMLLSAERSFAHEELKIQFQNMNPHLGQKFELRVINKATQKEVGRTSLAAITNHDFDVELEVIDIGQSYWIDFYADFNQNGRYDAPPTDHAWRLELNNVLGDTTLAFVHNVNFFDINWVYLLKVDFSNMNPHQGQLFELRVVDAGNGLEVGRTRFASLSAINFSIEIPGLKIGRNYYVDFYADLNQNGVYNAPPVDHAWRLEALNAAGDVTLAFAHNTSFTDVNWVNALIFNLANMNPHIGQKFEARVIDLYDRKEVGRASMDSIVVPNFTVEIAGIVPGHSYWLDYYADFNRNGVYDEPPVDHTWREQVTSNGNVTVNFSHNTNFTEIGWQHVLQLSLASMNPHLGQKFEARVIEIHSLQEVGRASLSAIKFPNFEVRIPVLLPNHSYRVDFYADLNQNGLFDAAPTDHVWREEFIPSAGDINIPFSHNTNFTETGWKYNFTLKLKNMNPHVGQKFEARVIDLSTMQEVGRQSLGAIVGPDFAVSIPNVDLNKTYWVDFYADFNQNGHFDAAPADHVWREQFTVFGDTEVEFLHNTNFTDTGWYYNFTLRLTNMNPHLGQKFEARVIDLSTMQEVGRKSLSAILDPFFLVSIPVLKAGGTYRVDFFADFNQNGSYDSPPVDHAWREQFVSNGDVLVDFNHNTNFTDIGWNYLFTLNLTNMNPHLGQKFELRVVDQADSSEISRKSLDSILVPNFAVTVPGLEPGKTYNVDFYADFNRNGLYDSPPTDHAWRESVTAAGDTKVDFSHNTTFTDIAWNYLFTLNLFSMNPHVGQLFELRVVDETNNSEVGRQRLDSILLPNFSVSVPGILRNTPYRVDYYADLNQNGQYNAPPADHAWRDNFMATGGDTTLAFTHNTNFTDIEWPNGVTAVSENQLTDNLPTEFALLQNYPNPFNPTTTIKFDLPDNSKIKLSIYNSLGQLVRVLVDEELPAGHHQAVWDGRDFNGRVLASGLYFYQIKADKFVKTTRMILMK